ncbi:ABC transporter permease [Actinotalea sp.]|uniref:ABC transporter permease n=1 Tax=Actinotalea sp. TaxID=1872145 RepID=UPI0035632230
MSAVVTTAEGGTPADQGREPRDASRRLAGRLARGLRRVPGSVGASIAVLSAVVVLVAISPLLESAATAQDLLLGTTPAGTPGHPFGTDDLGRDVLWLSLAGARSAVLGPVAIALGSMIFGIVAGMIAGYLGGFWDTVISRSTDLVLAMPPILMAIVVGGIVGGGYWVTVAVLVVLFAPSDIRMIRSAVLQARNQPYVEATQVLGLPTWRVMSRHLLPNVMPVVLTNVFLNVAFAIVAMSSLSYLGLGVSPGAADWGRQLADGRSLLYLNPAASVVPGLLIIVVATSTNLVGDWLADRLGVRSVA